MSALWLVVDKVTDRVIGYTRSGKAIAPPPDNVNHRHVGVNESEFATYQFLTEQARQEQRDEEISHNVGTGAVTLAADTRPIFEVIADKVEIVADGIDEVTLTITKKLLGGSTHIGFNTNIKTRLFERLVRLTFVNGIAIKTFKTTVGDTYRLDSNPRYKLIDSIEIDAVEV